MDLDKDLLARQEARHLAALAEKAAQALEKLPQKRLDELVEAAAAAFRQKAETLAEAAVRETGFGNVPDKIRKNRFASETVAGAIRGMEVLGIRKEEPGLWEIGVPVGVIAAIVPSTNPTSTVCYKTLIALKAGNAIIFLPHPKAMACTLQAVEVLRAALRQAGAPEGCVGCLTIPSMDGCRELMGAEPVKLILATGGPGMVKAAYSSGKPAIGVGAGNGPAYLHPSADLREALEKIARSKTFDNGTVCASEQSILVERDQEQQVLSLMGELGYYRMDPQEAQRLTAILFRPDGAMSPNAVGRTAGELARQAGFRVPEGTRVLVARETRVGREAPLSGEKLCPVLAMYTVAGEDEALSTAQALLRFEGRGHTFAIHAREEGVIRRFAREIPVSRFLVNVPAALGGIGAESKLFPALTLGCGAVGGSASSNNISPLDLINIRRVAWGTEKSTPRLTANEDLVELLAQRIMKQLRI